MGISPLDSLEVGHFFSKSMFNSFIEQYFLKTSFKLFARYKSKIFQVIFLIVRTIFTELILTTVGTYSYYFLIFTWCVFILILNTYLAKYEYNYAFFIRRIVKKFIPLSKEQFF